MATCPSIVIKGRVMLSDPKSIRILKGFSLRPYIGRDNCGKPGSISPVNING